MILLRYIYLIFIFKKPLMSYAVNQGVYIKYQLFWNKKNHHQFLFLNIKIIVFIYFLKVIKGSKHSETSIGLLVQFFLWFSYYDFVYSCPVCRMYIVTIFIALLLLFSAKTSSVKPTSLFY